MVLEAQSQHAGHDYSAFGGVLRSEIEFPELPGAHTGGRPDWTLIVSHAEPPAFESELVGQRLVGSERFLLSRSTTCYRIEYSHAGTFDLSANGARIVWYYDRQAVPELVRSMVLGPAMALAFELSGFLCLHGSAVATGAAAVAFLGPKHFGKSTLATALTAAGSRLIGDDLLVVSPGLPPRLRPGIASVRLWADMAAALPLDGVCNTLIPGVKTTITGFNATAVATDHTALRDIYLLSPTLSDVGPECVTRTRLSPGEAAIGLAQQTKLPDCLVGLRAAGTRLATAATIAAAVPIWRLHVLRDLSKLDGIVRQIIDWSGT
jgi:hypothetical protein